MAKSLSSLVTSDSNSYTAPVAEYDFLFSEAFGEDIIARATSGELTAGDARDALEGAAEFAAEVFAPLSQVGDREGAKLVNGAVQLPDGYAEAYRAFADAGWISASSSASAGGDDLPNTIVAALGEFWNGANMAFALNPALTQAAIRAIDALASDELRNTYLPKMVSGAWTGTMNLTEPQAGTDLAAVKSIARLADDGSWSVTGQKIYITWGDHELAENIVHLVLARTEGAPEGHRGLSLFLVPKYLPGADGHPAERNAITTIGLEHKLGIHASPTCVLQYDGATGFLLGNLHEGLQGMFVMMNEARSHMGMQGIGVATQAFTRANNYAHTRIQGDVLGRDSGTPIAEHPDVRRLLLSMSSRISAMRAFAVMAADLRDREEEPGNRELADFCVPIVKSWCTEEAVRITSDAIQIHGGMGFIEDTGAAQHYRDARIATIYEGTTAIQSNDLVGRKVLRNDGATVTQFIKQIRSTIEQLQGHAHPGAQHIAGRLHRATETAERATEALIANSRNDIRSAYAVSVPYQELLSELFGGWMHGVMVNAILQHETLSSADERRLVEADFFTTHQLPKVHALFEAVAAGEIVE